MNKIKPFITGTEQFDYWCRETDEGMYIFFANPKSQHLTFPLAYGQSLNEQTKTFSVAVSWHGKTIPVSLTFDPYQSLLLKINNNHEASFIDIRFNPKTPEYKERVKNGREKWEVDPDKK